ncbi:hypothetical protein PanWU01x14_362630 [Parasponia andersonii]|uniref:Uncharacterized protein n=1 Tax=Parasponia andersonii TaxID=3476 RepID=A0A2P5A6Z0_PARAD|nr:hypothetical protein PanWU01x14_362630 [Parasponia andersonii]
MVLRVLDAASILSLMFWVVVYMLTDLYSSLAFLPTLTSKWYSRAQRSLEIARDDGISHHGDDTDLDVQALRASVTSLEQCFDALSLDVQRILAAMDGENQGNNRPQ